MNSLDQIPFNNSNRGTEEKKEHLGVDFTFKNRGRVYNVISEVSKDPQGKSFYSMKIKEKDSPDSDSCLLRHVWMNRTELEDLLRFTRTATNQDLELKDIIMKIQNYIDNYPATHSGALKAI